MRTTSEDKKMYWDGGSNKAIRYYFYSQRGLALFNEFRYLFMIIFGAYVLMKLNNPVWLLVMFVISCPLLCLFGWLQVHKMAKVMDWLNVEFSTFWTRYSFDLQERQVKAVEEINHAVKEVRINESRRTAGGDGSKAKEDFSSELDLSAMRRAS